MKDRHSVIIVIFIVLCVGVLCFRLAGCKRRSSQPSESTIAVSESAITVDVTNEIPEIQVLEEFNDESVSVEESEGVSIEVDANTFIFPTPKQIQSALKNAGHYKGSIDGIIGSKSKRAILNFQRDNNLAADGKVGPKTWSKLKEHLDR